MMEEEYNLDHLNQFVYEAVMRARAGAWDPIHRICKDENTIYAEGCSAIWWLTFPIMCMVKIEIPHPRKDKKVNSF